jgi:hypothetical protein
MFFRSRKYLFGRDENPVAHMVSLLSQEAKRSGIPLNEEEKNLLGQDAPEHPLTGELREKFSRLIGQLLDREQSDGAAADPRSFGNSVEWAGDPEYPNIVAIAEEVISSRRPAESFAIRIRREMKDLTHLVGCAFAIVIVLGVIVGLCVLLFGSK